MQIIEIAVASGPQLLAFYNANATRLQDEKQVKKWADMNAARKRTAKLVEKLASYIENGKEGVDFPPEGCIMFPEEGDDLTEAVKTEDFSDVKPVAALPEAGEDTAEEEEDDLERGSFDAMGKALNGMADKPAAQAATRTEIGRASNSAGVALSWNDPKVREARLTRDGVEVEFQGNTEQFKSTGEAWRALRLPAGKHIRFRLKLKEAREQVYEFGGEKYTFRMVEIDDSAE